MDSKKCAFCRRVLPLNSFYPYRSKTKDGLTTYCRHCGTYTAHLAYKKKYGIVEPHKAELFSVIPRLDQHNKQVLVNFLKLTSKQGLVLKVSTDEVFKFNLHRVNDDLSTISVIRPDNHNVSCTFDRFHKESVDGVIEFLSQDDLRLMENQAEVDLFRKLFFDGSR